ncbi:hypothetical protein LLS1_28760 [Leifsonia sp. LS1]|uniref:DUF1996 domain-containing protein n=1 Tax=Leifsonia sp. LS1 TaxID=2828483 RepID=UPI001CFE9B19|nr:DUF1996 domain-containing protein [Leifsonia sp. LS1]GIT81207.1 hypothetical protein LLS1_28760 [Leifsonia sp. LS1]
MSALRIPSRVGIALAAATALVLAVGTAAATAAVTAAGVFGSSAPPVSTAGFPAGGHDPGIFTDTCSRSLTAPNDPIMMPGMSGMSMQHDFFGNPAVVASSTASTLRGGPTTCSTSADASAYWTPVVYQRGTALVPSRTLLYWRDPAAIAAATHAMPEGISLIAGDESATAPQSTSVVDWTCTTTRRDPHPTRDSLPHDCAGGSQLRLVITFPNCWDGRTMDGRDRSGAVYATATGCPSSYPVQIPQIVLHVTYPTSSAAGITLSTGPDTHGPPVTGHADFVDGWQQPRMAADVAACVDAQVRCGPVRGADATPQGGRQR